MSRDFKYNLEIDFASIELYEDYLIATIHEGVVFKAEHFKQFHQIFREHFYNRPFGYISNRKNDYTVDPTGYKLDGIHFDNLVGVATLCYSEQSKKNADFAAQFFEYPHAAFYSKEECVAFITDLIQQRKK